MKLHTLILSLAMMLVGGACAHKSGHNRQNLPMSNSSTSVNRSVSTSRPAMEQEHTPRDLGVEVSSRHGEKLEGTEIFSKYNHAVFMVFTSDGINGYQGSGFFINNKGLAVSNYHVFKGTNKGQEQIKLSGSDTAYKVVEVIASDQNSDFILFRVNCSDNDFIPVAGSKPQVGEKVYAIGSPRGLENTFSSGEVSQWRDTNLMQINVQIDHGSSGGALINEYGQVVGITSGTFVGNSQANLNYAWSIDVVKPYINLR